MNSKDYKKWKAIREKGKLKYILVNSVLFFGLPVGVGTAIAGLIGDDVSSMKMVISTVIALFCGLFFAVATWSMNESLFRRHSSAGR